MTPPEPNRAITPDPDEATILLQRAAAGDPLAAEQLFPLVYDRLRALAGVYIRGRPEHTLQATALAHEAYLRLVAASDAPNDREHFLAIAATAMRQILADHARRRLRLKRGGGQERVSLDVAAAQSEREEEDLVALHVALERLARADPRRYRVVELRFLGGLTVGEAALAMDVSERTIESDWRVARVWLQTTLGGEE
ncbi:MAG: ECF-type sigma factor [Phycisphaerae bacterium]|nr:ECF-type sigma factor [Phycisphaerae bacterium]